MPGHTTGGRRKPSPPPEPNSENVDLTTMVDSMIKSVSCELSCGLRCVYLRWAPKQVSGQ